VTDGRESRQQQDRPPDPQPDTHRPSDGRTGGEKGQPMTDPDRLRVDQLATALAEVLACLYALTRVDGSVIGWQTANVIRPATYDRWQAALQPAAPAPSHDSGPDVAECAAADRNWDIERHGE